MSGRTVSCCTLTRSVSLGNAVAGTNERSVDERDSGVACLSQPRKPLQLLAHAQSEHLLDDRFEIGHNIEGVKVEVCSCTRSAREQLCAQNILHVKPFG